MVSATIVAGGTPGSNQAIVSGGSATIIVPSTLLVGKSYTLVITQLNNDQAEISVPGIFINAAPTTAAAVAVPISATLEAAGAPVLALPTAASSAAPLPVVLSSSAMAIVTASDADPLPLPSVSYTYTSATVDSTASSVDAVAGTAAGTNATQAKTGTKKLDSAGYVMILLGVGFLVAVFVTATFSYYARKAAEVECSGPVVAHSHNQ
ncbi:hypothetical protein HDU76_008590 [Blyttiomyces sp. JEL0837]|nr:hypothetical protein HDU76_008590 [Blyttiomyces sp. JEL0837]